MSSSSSGGGVRGGDFEGPSSSRRRSGNGGVWPEPFIEALATQVAVDASRSAGRLAAAPALSNIFQVCSTWRAVSHSELLWQNLTRTIWNTHTTTTATWQELYVYRHRTASNFRQRQNIYSAIHPIPPDNNDNDDNNCSRIVISGPHLASGHSDGSLRLFYLPSGVHVATFRPRHRDDRLGRFSPAVSGIVLSEARVVFASINGDVHVGPMSNATLTRRAMLGDVVRDGALVDFCGCDRWWVGLYAGVPGRSFHVWNGETQELTYIGGTLTDPEAVMGWHQLTDLTDSLGRVRLSHQNSAIACTSHGYIIFDLNNPENILGGEQFRRGLIVGAFDSAHQTSQFVDTRGAAIVRRVHTLAEVCRFIVRGISHRTLFGCMNLGYSLMCAGGVIRVWENEHGGYIYSFRERLGDVSAMAVDDRHVAVCTRDDTTIHLWDFGAQ